MVAHNKKGDWLNNFEANISTFSEIKGPYEIGPETSILGTPVSNPRGIKGAKAFNLSTGLSLGKNIFPTNSGPPLGTAL